MELIDRYIYAVTRLQPEKQREDLEKELRSLIDDMLAERTGEANASSEDIEAVLKELGEPSVLAAQYSGKPRYLIGPEIFDTYSRILKIVPAAAAFGVLIALIVNYVASPPVDLGEAFGSIIGSIFSAALEAFAWVTLIFALIERSAPDSSKIRRKAQEWKPIDLPEIPVKRSMIRRSEPIAAIIFIMIFGILINLAPGLFIIYSPKMGIESTMLFNPDALRMYLPLINIGFLASFIKEVLKLVYGRYNLRLAVTTIILGSISFVLTVVVFLDFSIWNPDFVLAIQQLLRASLPAGYDPAQGIMLFSNVFLCIIIFSFVLETLKTVFKTIKFSTTDARSFINRNR